MVLKRGLILLTASTALFLAACNNPHASTAKATDEHTAQGRKPAPDFTLPGADGSQVKLSDLRGKVVVVNFWATWCGPCQLEIPWFVEFEQQFRSQGLEIVGVSMDEDGWKVVKPFMSTHKMNYRVALGNETVGQLYGGVDNLPTTYILDRQGNIAFVHVGLAGKNEYQDEITKLLGSGNTNQSHAMLTRDPGPRAAS